MGTDMNRVTEVNFDERIQKLKNLQQMWAGRSLTLRGKITVIQTPAIPQLLYTCTVLYVPSQVFEKV